MSFVSFWESLVRSDEQAQATPWRFFSKDGYYALYGVDAERFAAQIFRTSSELKDMHPRRSDDATDTTVESLTYCNVRREQFEQALPSLLESGAEVRIYALIRSRWTKIRSGCAGDASAFTRELARSGFDDTMSTAAVAVSCASGRGISIGVAAIVPLLRRIILVEIRPDAYITGRCDDATSAAARNRNTTATVASVLVALNVRHVILQPDTIASSSGDTSGSTAAVAAAVRAECMQHARSARHATAVTTGAADDWDSLVGSNAALAALLASETSEPSARDGFAFRSEPAALAAATAIGSAVLGTHDGGHKPACATDVAGMPVACAALSAVLHTLDSAGGGSGAGTLLHPQGELDHGSDATMRRLGGAASAAADAGARCGDQSIQAPVRDAMSQTAPTACGDSGDVDTDVIVIESSSDDDSASSAVAAVGVASVELPTSSRQVAAADATGPRRAQRPTRWSLHVFNPLACMQLDAAALSALSIFPNASTSDAAAVVASALSGQSRMGGNSGSSLFSFLSAGLCLGAMGRRMLSAWLRRPLLDPAALRDRQGIVAALYGDPSLRQKVRASLTSVQRRTGDVHSLARTMATVAAAVASNTNHADGAVDDDASAQASGEDRRFDAQEKRLSPQEAFRLADVVKVYTFTLDIHALAQHLRGVDPDAGSGDVPNSGNQQRRQRDGRPSDKRRRGEKEDKHDGDVCIVLSDDGNTTESEAGESRTVAQTAAQCKPSSLHALVATIERLEADYGATARLRALVEDAIDMQLLATPRRYLHIRATWHPLLSSARAKLDAAESKLDLAVDGVRAALELHGIPSAKVRFEAAAGPLGPPHLRVPSSQHKLLKAASTAATAGAKTKSARSSASQTRSDAAPRLHITELAVRAGGFTLRRRMCAAQRRLLLPQLQSTRRSSRRWSVK